MDWELRRFRDSVIHYNKGGVVMSCYRSPLTGGVYLYTYPVEKTSPDSDATVRSLVNSSIQRNNSRGLRGVNPYVRVVEDWRKDMLQIHLDDGWFDARPYQKFAYFDFMLRTKGAGSRVVYRTQEHITAWGACSVECEEEVLIPALYYDKGQDIALTMERDATDPAAVYMIRFQAHRNEETAVRYRMSDSALVKAQEAGVDKATRQRRPSASAGGGGGGASGSGSSGSSAKKPKPAKWGEVTTVAEAYAMLDIAMGPVATKEEADLVKKAYFKHAAKLHPDKGGDKAEFQELGRAVTMIRDGRFAGTGWLNVNAFGAVY
jgi:sulfur carrier protein ThiS